MTENNDPFSFFDFSIDEARESERTHKNGADRRDKRVCLCGHAMSAHMVDSVSVCSPSKMYCPCKVARAVLEVQDCRLFVRKTRGAGSQHALSLGVVASLERGKKVEWIIEQRCDRCKTPGKVSPVPVTHEGFARSDATGFDALLCMVCRESV